MFFFQFVYEFVCEDWFVCKFEDLKDIWFSDDFVMLFKKEVSNYWFVEIDGYGLVVLDFDFIVYVYFYG